MSGNRELKELLTYATQHTEEINETSFGDLSSKMTADEWEDWDYKILSALTTLTTGSSHSLVETAKVGMEAWRLLTQRWDPKSMRKKNTIIRKIMAIARATTPKELHNGVILLRQYCNEYSRDYGGEYDEESRKAVLMGICPDKLEEELLTKGLDKGTIRFEEVMDAVQEWLRKNASGVNVGSLGKDDDKQWGGEYWDEEQWADDKCNRCDGRIGLELGWVGYKGKSKGGAKGKGGEQFQGYCDFCGAWGHRQNACNKKTEYLKGKGKGYKGKGKDRENKGNGGKGNWKGYGSYKENWGGKGYGNAGKGWGDTIITQQGREHMCYKMAGSVNITIIIITGTDSMETSNTQGS